MAVTAGALDVGHLHRLGLKPECPGQLTAQRKDALRMSPDVQAALVSPFSHRA
jgi:hypothetical protein